MKKDIKDIDIIIGTYNRERFNALFDGWHRYKDAPREATCLMEEIDDLITYSNGEYDFFWHISDKSAKKRHNIGFVRVVFRNDGTLIMRLSPFYCRRIWEFVQDAVILVEVKKLTLRKYGIIG